MHKTILFSVLFFISTNANANNFFVQSGETNRNKINHIVLIGVDGLGGHYLKSADAPHVKSIMSKGAWTFEMQNVLPSDSGPNWMSILTGKTPAQHGVFSNGWERGESNIGHDIFGWLEFVSDGEIQTNFFYEWSTFNEYIPLLRIDNKEYTGETKKTVEKVKSLKLGKKSFTFIHFDLVDHEGHYNGYGSDDYFQAIKTVDIAISEILQHFKKNGLYDNTVFIVTSDHGGKGHSHGGDTLVERSSPLLVMGPGIQRKRITREVRIFDIPATVAFLFGYNPSPQMLGRPLLNIIEGYLPVHSNKTLELIESKQFEWIYDDKGSGADEDLSIWRAYRKADQFLLGDFAKKNYDLPAISNFVLKDQNELTSMPLGFEKILDDKGSGADSDVSFWRPIPPLGYTCLGDVATNSFHKVPEKKMFRCVREDFVQKSSFTSVWKDTGSGADWDFELYSSKGSESSIAPKTFRVRGKHDDPGNKKVFLSFKKHRVHVVKKAN